ncbi:hypothetical protein P8452_18427 [Trifolium repens]|nr:hypothetical protein P8452_18427 [Trifolium repens]
MQLAPVTADIKMRKLGNTASPPPSPIRNHPPGTISNPIILRLKSGVDGSENFLVMFVFLMLFNMKMRKPTKSTSSRDNWWRSSSTRLLSTVMIEATAQKISYDVFLH